jgi:hypothetical protein
MKILQTLILLFCLMIPGQSPEAHVSPQILQCSIFAPLHPHGEPEIIDVRLSQNGLFSELYDINGDGRPDLALYSPTYGIVEQKGLEDIEVIHGIGILYEIDFEPQDGAPDLIYIDITGEQNCQGLTLYYELYKPDAGSPDKRPKGAMINWDGVEFFQHKR